MKQLNESTYEVTHFCLFAGMGGLSSGLNRGHARVGRLQAQMRCLGGVDNWPVAVRNFDRLTGSKGTVLDLFDRADYEAFHGKPPPAGWREATPDDLRKAAGGECPDIVATSPPCKSFSGLLNPTMAASPKYQALNRLVIRGLQLTLLAFADDPPAFILLENVPRIRQRGRQLLDEVEGLLRAYGYSVNETVHDCGELGGLSQRRPRFLLVARNTAKIKPFIYVPPKSRVKSIGDALQHLPLPEVPWAGPMHRLPRLEWLTWLRLALIPAGKDWRALQDYAIADGYLRDVGIVPLGADWHRGPYGVKGWGEVASTVTGHPGVTCGAHAVADPCFREGQFGTFQPYGVVPWGKASGTVTAQAEAGSGAFTVQDPRLQCDIDDRQGRRHNNVYRVVQWADPCNAVTSGTGPTSGGLNVADPGVRSGALGKFSGKMQIRPWDDPGRVVTGDTDVQAGAQCIQDPRLTWGKDPAGNWKNGGHYGVADWDQASNAVVAHAKHDNGVFSVADPRGLPKPDDRPDPVPLIVSLDDTWHRPLTTLELAHLQGYPVFGADGRVLDLDGSSDQILREQIGNSVPPPAAEAIGRVVGEAMLANQLGETFTLRADEIWVQPVQVALSMPGYGEA